MLYTEKTAYGSLTPRRLQIPDELSGRLRSWRRQRGIKAYLFRQEYKDTPHYLMWADKKLKAILKGLGMDWFSVGCSRHYFASKLANEKVPLVKTQSIMGHCSLRTTEWYIRDLVGV
ncbi:hypothetical protein DFAR_200016 [Desulfarculales bacterium]